MDPKKLFDLVTTTITVIGYARTAWKWGEKNGYITYGPPRSLSRGPRRF